MYLPEAYKIKDVNRINQFIRENSFADLVTINKGHMTSNKVPLYFDENENAIFGHFGRNNSQLIDLQNGNDILVIFSGADAYISPNWVNNPNMVPTWNFQTLQIRGKASILDDNGLLRVLEKLTDTHETDLASPWSITALSTSIRQKLLKMIVGFKIEIEEINFKEKMSQTRDISDRREIVDALNKQNNHAGSIVAAIMKENLPTT